MWIRMPAHEGGFTRTYVNKLRGIQRAVCPDPANEEGS